MRFLEIQCMYYSSLRNIIAQWYLLIVAHCEKTTLLINTIRIVGIAEPKKLWQAHLFAIPYTYSPRNPNK